MAEKKKRYIEHWQKIAGLMFCYDFASVLFSYFLALWIRYDCKYTEIPGEYFSVFLSATPVLALVCLAVYSIFRLYNSIWRFASLSELIRVIEATVLVGVIHVLGVSFIFGSMPVSYYVFGLGFQFVFCIGMRFSFRMYLHIKSRRRGDVQKKNQKNVMVIGAGEAARILIRDSVSTKSNYVVCCAIDDNPNKWGRTIGNVPIVGGRDSIIEKAEEYNIDEILFAIPSARPIEKKEILNICKESNCKVKSLPGVFQIMNDEINIDQFKEVEVEDLLGRDPIIVDLKTIFAELRDKVVLITGAGGSIGSELARQVAGHMPKKLVLVDIYENNVYDVQLDLKARYPELDLEVLIASVRDGVKMYRIFEEHKPEFVYHAAAHKHVPLMEDSACEAIKNNTLGTYKTAFAAMANGCKRFVLISTDKAVNPTNIMGASKRLCEMVVQAFDYLVKKGKASDLPRIYGEWLDPVLKTDEVCEKLEATKTEFVAVRFGNVLGSNGSVIPLFKRQIEKGGPVTVTHPDIIRYFMTIPEAVSLVLQAGMYASGGEIFVLDMGDPVKIDTLARELISLSGLRPDVDIKIVYTGLRPGEKLYEEKLMAEEGLKKTANKLIHIGLPIPFEAEQFLGKLEKLEEAAYENRADIRDLVVDIVGTYHPEVEEDVYAEVAVSEE